MTLSPSAASRARWLARQTGVHLPYLDLLPASETVRYARAAIAMLVSVFSAFAGWALVGSWSAAGVPPLPRTGLAIAAGLAAAIVVWSVDRELISGDGHLGTRSVIGAVNALFVGEIVLLALFAPFVEDQIDNHRLQTHAAAVAEAQTTYDEAISQIDDAQSTARPNEPASLTQARDDRGAALSALSEAEDSLAFLKALRTAEVTGRVVVGDDGQQLTSGRPGDQGVATDSLDRQIAAAEEALARADAELEQAEERLQAAETSYSTEIAQSDSQATRFDSDRTTAQQERDAALIAADEARTAHVGLLRRIDLFHHGVWTDAVLAIAVIAVHIAVLAAELSVVMWAINDRRRGTRLYPELVEHIDERSVDALPELAQAIVDSSIARVTGVPTTPASAIDGSNLAATSLREEITGFDLALPPAHDDATTDDSRAPHSEPVHDAALAATKPDAPDVPAPSSHDVKQYIDEVLRPKPIEVYLLRPTAVASGLGKTLRPKQLAVLAYLAVSRSIQTADVRSAFWPESRSNSASDNAISAIRRALGDARDGKPRLGSQERGQLTLSEEVGSDWARFVELVGAPAPHDEAIENQIAPLAAALRLIEGRPCSAPLGAGGNWSWIPRLLASDGHLGATVRLAADQLIPLAMAAGRPDLASWAADQTRLVIPSYEAPPHLTEGEPDATDRLAIGT